MDFLQVFTNKPILVHRYSQQKKHAWFLEVWGNNRKYEEIYPPFRQMRWYLSDPTYLQINVSSNHFQSISPSFQRCKWERQNLGMAAVRQQKNSGIPPSRNGAHSQVAQFPTAVGWFSGHSNVFKVFFVRSQIRGILQHDFTTWKDVCVYINGGFLKLGYP